MIPKRFLSADALVRDAFRLARDIYHSGFEPDALLVLWRGGTPIGIVIHEFLQFKGIDTYHAVVKAVSYTGIGQRIEPQLEGMEAVLAQLEPDSRILVVDDIFDSGCTIARVCEQLEAPGRTVRVATLYRKAGANQTSREPDYVLRETDEWIVFPHELEGLSADEIRAKDPVIHDLLNGSDD